jgi:glutamate 5-kinase
VTVACGRDPSILGRVLAGADAGTTFAPQTSPREFRKFWIAHGATVAGQIHVDSGAVRALHAGRSLLPAGITSVEGEFKFGDTVAVVGPDRQEVARGLVNYAAADLSRLAGVRSERIGEILGAYFADEAIHRNNLALL